MDPKEGWNPVVGVAKQRLSSQYKQPWDPLKTNGIHWVMSFHYS